MKRVPEADANAADYAGVIAELRTAGRNVAGRHCGGTQRTRHSDRERSGTWQAVQVSRVLMQLLV
jgi:hypothetical protein